MKFNQVELKRQAVRDDAESDDHIPEDVTAVLLGVAGILVLLVLLAVSLSVATVLLRHV